MKGRRKGASLKEKKKGTKSGEFKKGMNCPTNCGSVEFSRKGGSQGRYARDVGKMSFQGGRLAGKKTRDAREGIVQGRRLIPPDVKKPRSLQDKGSLRGCLRGGRGLGAE